MKTRTTLILLMPICAAMLSSFGATSAVGQVWTATGNMNQHRYRDTITLLPSGKVLVAGGGGTGAPCESCLQSCELYDPTTQLWTPTGSMSHGRYWHTATLLNSGKVLVAAGNGFASGFEDSSELYDPATGTWSPTGGGGIAGRKEHNATLLASGQVLVTGGLGYFGALNTAQVYDPTTETWRPTGSMTDPRIFHTATLLPSGKVLVAGGDGATGYTTAELYDPVTEVWTPTGSLITGREGHTATLLPSGKVLVAGGRNDIDRTVSSAELYDPATGLWTATGSMLNKREVHLAAVLSSGQVLVAGGFNYFTLSYLTSSELYDPATELWTATGNLLTARGTSAGTVQDPGQNLATLLPSGEVLVAGGFNFTDGPLSSAELYSPAASPTPTPTPTPSPSPSPTPQPSPTPTPTPTPSCTAQVQPPINADGSSVWTVKRGVVPVKFRLTCGGNSTCDLPPATIAVTRTAGGSTGTINESIYSNPADTGSNFRVDGCQYIYNLESSSLGTGTYRVDILISSQVVGSAVFQLK